MCIDIFEIWFGIANGQISSIFDRVICPPFSFPTQCLMKLAQNVCPGYKIWVKFETESLGVKTRSAGQRKNLVITEDVTFLKQSS